MASSVLFSIDIDSDGEVTVKNAATGEVLQGRNSLSPDYPMSLGDKAEMVKFEPIVVMAFRNGAQALRICIKRANCSWVCM